MPVLSLSKGTGSVILNQHILESRIRNHESFMN